LKKELGAVFVKEGKSMRTIRISLIVGFVLILITGCNSPQKLAQAEANPQAWFDAPLNGSILTLDEAYEVVFHIASLGGVAQGELTINSEVIARLPNPNGSSSPATIRQLWTPFRPGTYTLKARALSVSGQWSEYDTVVVTVNDETPTPTSTPTPTLTPTMTMTTTVTPTGTTTPTPTLEGFVFDPSPSTDLFEYQRDCFPDPASVTINVNIAGPGQIKYVYIFYHIENVTTGEKTEWNDGVPMVKGENGNYSKKISWKDISNLDVISADGDDGYFLYQFVVTSTTGANIGRSQVYGNITLSPCE